MAVVINEFEVVPGEIQSDQEARVSPKSEGPPRPQPSAREIELMIEQQFERDERVWAH